MSPKTIIRLLSAYRFLAPSMMIIGLITLLISCGPRPGVVEQATDARGYDFAVCVDLDSPEDTLDIQISSTKMTYMYTLEYTGVAHCAIISGAGHGIIYSTSRVIQVIRCSGCTFDEVHVYSLPANYRDLEYAISAPYTVVPYNEDTQTFKFRVAGVEQGDTIPFILAHKVGPDAPLIVPVDGLY